jgi:hypothetical protein
MKTKSITQFVMSTFVSVCMLFGCVGATKYAPENRWDLGTKVQGYRDAKIANDLFQVSFAGNNHTPDDTAYNYCLYRCAEVTKQNGFDYFMIITEKDVTTHAAGLAVHPGGAIASTVRFPSYNFKIKCGKGVKPNDDNAFYAAEIIRNLGPSIRR